MIIYGKNVVYEAIINNHEIFEIYIDNKFKDLKILKLIEKSNIKHLFYPKDKINEISNSQTNQGICARVRDYKTYSLDDVINEENLKLIILDNIQDPHNLGAVIRSAEASNMTAIIISNKNSVGITPSVVKVSAGAIERVKIVVVNNINNAIIKLKQNNILVYGMDMDSNITYKDIDKTQKLAIVLGSEGQGLRYLVRQNCSYIVKIPMLGKINSLNVSIAAAIVMFEIM